MSLENINCPQFVDFCSVDTFDIHDGADFCFEKGVVGEDAKLNTMFQSINTEKNDQTDELVSVFSNSTNLNKKKENEEDKKAAKLTPNKIQKLENKENLNLPSSSSTKSNEKEKKTEIVGTSAPSVGSAIELVYKNASKNPPNRAKTPIKNSSTAIVNTSNHKRTLSTSSAHSVNNVSKTNDKPLLPLYRGVKFIPKLAHKYSQNSVDSYQPSTTINTSENHHYNNNEKRLIQANKVESFTLHKTSICEKKTTSNLTRSTPGKSASFKQATNLNNSQKKSNLITNLTSNMVKAKPTLLKTASYSSDAEFNLSHNKNTNSLENTHDSSINKMSRNNSKTNISGLNSRKKSDSSNKPVGLLHTELRALKRTEYDHHMKEKERMANLLRQDLEQEKMKKQQEEIQKLRIKNTFRSNPIKHYKPVEIKPSEKPLTSPISPQFSINSSIETKTKYNSLTNVSITTTQITTNTTQVCITQADN